MPPAPGHSGVTLGPSPCAFLRQGFSTRHDVVAAMPGSTLVLLAFVTRSCPLFGKPVPRERCAQHGLGGTWMKADTWG